METANSHLMLILAETRRSDLERRAKADLPRFGWLSRRTTKARNTPRSSAPLTRRKAY